MGGNEQGPGWSDRPGADEYAPYYGGYLERVPGGDVLATLESQIGGTLALLRSVPAAREGWRYAPDKWSIREAVGHVIDVERLFSFRALWFARSAEGALPGMEQDDWVRASNAGARELADLLAEWETLRASTLRLFRSLAPDALGRRGVASGVEFTVRAVPWIVAGHELHHRLILVERYGIGG
jgi:hypothetical protein